MSIPQEEKATPMESDFPDFRSTMTTELATVPFTEIAHIAATLMREGKSTRDAITEAYELLEIAARCQWQLKQGNSYQAGIKDFDENAAMEEGLRARFAVIPKYRFKLDESGQKLPVPLDEGLAVLFPLPGVSKTKASIERRKRLERWLIDRWREANPNQSEQEGLKECRDLIARLEKEGIPASKFDKWRVLIPEWWDAKKREMNAAKAQLAKPDKKRKQGRVKSKDDKRLGGRTRPLGHLLGI